MILQVFVATHKKYWMPTDKVYKPLHVGKAVKDELGYFGDDTGDNISYKNSNYCELTGLYWIWKNVKSNYVGLCHYRRYFAKDGNYYLLKSKKLAILVEEEINHYLDDYDIVLPRKYILKNDTVRQQYEKLHKAKDLAAAQEIINEVYPEYSVDFEAVMLQRELYVYNMFISHKAVLDKYCSWLFDILFELEKRIDIGDYDQYQARVYGFLSERLFNIWLHHQALKIKECNVVFLDDEESSNLRILIRFMDDHFPKMMDGLRTIYTKLIGKTE